MFVWEAAPADQSPADQSRAVVDAYAAALRMKVGRGARSQLGRNHACAVCQAALSTLTGSYSLAVTSGSVHFRLVPAAALERRVRSR